MKQRTRALLCASVLAIGLTVVPATAAQADPSGCYKVLDGWGANAFGVLWASGSGYCSAPYNYQTLEVEIKQDISWQPDPVALKSSDAGTKSYYHAAPSGCDNGNYAVYYARVFFGGHSDYLDAFPHTTYQSC